MNALAIVIDKDCRRIPKAAIAKMTKPQNSGKLVLAVCATVLAVTAFSLIVAGSFVPRWARPLNVSMTEANTTFSLWGKEDCYGIICTNWVRTEYHETTKKYKENGQWKVEVFKKVIRVPQMSCKVANYCNMSWFGDVDFHEVPSLLFVARAFIIPSMITGFICIVIYIIKIIILMLRPNWRRLHVKAAYLTFAAVAGMSSGIGVIVFATMLEKETFELMWAWILPGIGAVLYLLIAIGGYLSWRNHSTDEEFDDRSEFSDRLSHSGMYEFSASGKGHAMPGPSSGRKANTTHVHGKSYQRSVSQQSSKSDVL